MTTTQIYQGAIAFIVLQLVMVIAVVMYPSLSLDGLDKGPAAGGEGQMQLEMPMGQGGDSADGQGNKDGNEEDEDPSKALMRSLTKDK